MLGYNFSPSCILPYKDRTQCEEFSVCLNHNHKMDIECIRFLLIFFLIRSKTIERMEMRLDFLSLLWNMNAKNIVQLISCDLKDLYIYI